MYSLFTGKEEVCMKDFENYIIEQRVHQYNILH